MNKDVRYIQRYDNYTKAFRQLKDAIKLSNERELSLLEKQGLIQAFEFTHELAWKLLKDYLNYQGHFEIRGSRDAIREAFNAGIIKDGTLWMQTIQTRNLTAHTYDEEIAEETYEVIANDYITLFEDLLNTYQIDFVQYDKISNPNLKEHIDRVGVVL